MDRVIERQRHIDTHTGRVTERQRHIETYTGRVTESVSVTIAAACGPQELNSRLMMGPCCSESCWPDWIVAATESKVSNLMVESETATAIKYWVSLRGTTRTARHRDVTCSKHFVRLI